MAVDAAAERTAVELRWGTSVGCMVPLGAFGAVFFAWLAANPGAVVSVDGRRDSIFRMLAPVIVGGVNLPFLFLAMWCVWQVGRFGWRWSDEVTVAATSKGLRFHGSLFRKPLAWSEVLDVRFAPQQRGLATVPCLVVTPRRGRSLVVRAVDNDEGRAERFAELARRHADGDPSTLPEPAAKEMEDRQGE